MRIPRILTVAVVATLLAAACRPGAAPGEQPAAAIKTDVGVEGQTIKLGELSPLTGSVALIGKPLTRGHEVYFKYVNDVLGGVGRKLPADKRYKVELVTLDTQYLPDVHVQQYSALKGKVLLVAQSLGTPTTKAMLPQVREDKILVGAATLSSDWLREKYLVPAGAPYPVQFINAVQYLKDRGVTPKLGIIYQNDDYGEDGLKGLEFAAKQFGFTIVAKATYRPDDAEFAAQVTAMKNAGADHVFLTTVPTPTGRILGTAATLNYAPQWIGQSPAWIGALVGTKEKPSPLVPYMQKSLWIVTDGACGWGETQQGCEGMKEMIDNWQKFAADQPPDYYFSFGYTQARIVHQVLEKAIELGDLTRAGTLKAFESLKNVDMGGLLNPVSFGPRCEDKVPTTASTIWKVDTNEPIALARVARIDSAAIKQFPFCP